jgi:hypothetical protein
VLRCFANMPALTQPTKPNGNYSPNPCSKCGAKELQRTPRRFFHTLAGLYPYVCVRCAARESKFRRGPGTLIRALIVFLVAGAIVIVVQRPAWLSFRHADESSTSTTEALAQARTSAGGLSTFEQMMIKKPRSTMDNSTILKLWKANVGPNVILQLIRTSNPDYDVSASAIIELKEAGVDQTIILAMIDASYNTR